MVRCALEIPYMDLALAESFVFSTEYIWELKKNNKMTPTPGKEARDEIFDKDESLLESNNVIR